MSVPGCGRLYRGPSSKFNGSCGTGLRLTNELRLESTVAIGSSRGPRGDRRPLAYGEVGRSPAGGLCGLLVLSLKIEFRMFLLDLSGDGSRSSWGGEPNVGEIGCVPGTTFDIRLFGSVPSDADRSCPCGGARRNCSGRPIGGGGGPPRYCCGGGPRGGPPAYCCPVGGAPW